MAEEESPQNGFRIVVTTLHPGVPVHEIGPRVPLVAAPEVPKVCLVVEMPELLLAGILGVLNEVADQSHHKVRVAEAREPYAIEVMPLEPSAQDLLDMARQAAGDTTKRR